MAILAYYKPPTLPRLGWLGYCVPMGLGVAQGLTGELVGCVGLFRWGWCLWGLSHRQGELKIATYGLKEGLPGPNWVWDGYGRGARGIREKYRSHFHNFWHFEILAMSWCCPVSMGARWHSGPTQGCHRPPAGYPRLLKAYQLLPTSWGAWLGAHQPSTSRQAWAGTQAGGYGRHGPKIVTLVPRHGHQRYCHLA